MYDKMFATVKGHDCRGNEFETNLEFNLVPPAEGESHYGTGYYMVVKHSCKNDPPLKDYVDVRYEQTTDIEILADRWIKNYYGKNAEEVTKEFPAEE